MATPFRIWAIPKGETTPSWWITLDVGVTFRRADFDQRQVHNSELVLVGHGLNDVVIATRFEHRQRAGFQPAGKYDGT